MGRLCWGALRKSVCVLTSIQQEVVFDSLQVSNEIVVGDKILEEVFRDDRRVVRYFVPPPLERRTLLDDAST